MKRALLLSLLFLLGICLAYPAFAQDSMYAVGINKKAKKVGWFNGPESERWDGSWSFSGDNDVTFDTQAKTWTLTIDSTPHVFTFYPYHPEEMPDLESVSVAKVTFSSSTIEAFFSDGTSETYREYLNVSPAQTADGQLLVCLTEFKYRDTSGKWKMISKKYYPFQ